MHPLLINLGPIPIHTYGFMIAIGFLVTINVVKRLSLRAGLNVERMMDLCFWSMLVGFVGARLLFVLTRLSYFMNYPFDILKVWEGGSYFSAARWRSCRF